jgi:hypothetical protein
MGVECKHLEFVGPDVRGIPPRGEPVTVDEWRPLLEPNNKYRVIPKKG